MRVSTFSIFDRVLIGMRSSQLAGLRAQAQLATGRRIQHASDDPVGTARSVALRRDLSQTDRIRDAIAASRTRLELASSTLQHSSDLLSRARELVLQAMNGTLNADDRRTVANELGEIRDQLLDDANLQFDGNYLFSGTALGTQPFQEVVSGGLTHAVYRGNGEQHSIRTGEHDFVSISAIGNEIFGRFTPGPVRFDGLTGLRSGTTADEGAGYSYVALRHDGTDSGLLGSVGAALIDGGDRDTLLGINALVIDSTAQTVRLNGGPAVAIPPAGSRADVLVTNEQGGELHLDLEGWNGSDYTGTVIGRGSIALDGEPFVALTFTETDLELRNPALGRVLHVDTRSVLRAGTELATYGDTVNPFDLLQGAIEDLENEQELDPKELADRLTQRLDSLDRIHDDLLVGLGVLGARTARLISAGERQADLGLQLQGRISDVEDVDLAEAALDLSRSQMILELAQAAGARVMQTSLLNFLG